MKAVVVYTVDDSTQTEIIEGPFIVDQTYPDGRGRVVVYDERGGRRLRRFTVARAWSIDIQQDSQEPGERAR